MARAGVGMQAHIGVVIAGDSGDVARVSQMTQPVRRAQIFFRETQIDEIAGDGDMVADIYRERVLKRGGRPQNWGWDTAYPAKRG